MLNEPFHVFTISSVTVPGILYLLNKALWHLLNFLLVNVVLIYTVEPRFNEVAGDRSNFFVKWRVCYIENLNITNLRGNDQNVRYIEVIVND